KFASVTSPSCFHVVDPRRGRSFLRPREEILDALLFTLRDDFDRSVASIFYPSRQTKLPCFPLGRGPEEHPLYTAPNDQVDSFLSHGVTPANVGAARYRKATKRRPPCVRNQ